MSPINLFSQESMLYRKRIILIYSISSAMIMLTILMAQLYFHNLTIQTNKLNNTIQQDKQIIKNTPNLNITLQTTKPTYRYQNQYLYINNKETHYLSCKPSADSPRAR